MNEISTFEAAARLSRAHSGKAWGDLNTGETLAVIAAMNGAMVDLWQLVPPVYREQRLVVSGNVRSQSVQVTNGASQVHDGPFQVAELDRTVVFSGGGDTGWYRVGSTHSLSMPWAGVSGTYSTVIHPDVIRLDNEEVHVEQVVGMPVFIDEAGNRRNLRLITNWDHEVLMNAPRFGIPEAYWVEAYGMPAGEATSLAIRLWPIPVALVRVEMRALWAPARLRAVDIRGDFRLNVPASMIEEFLELAGARLALAPGFGVVGVERAVEVSRGAMARLRMRIPTVQTPRNRIGTPVGW